MKFSIVILSKTDSKEIFEMCKLCMNSFINSVQKAKLNYEIILVESNPQADYDYNVENLRIVYPKEVFNFHKFSNVGIRQASGDYIVLSNNDVVYDINSFSEILNAINKYPNIKSFSPYHKMSNRLPRDLVDANQIVLGYDLQKHLTGWCLVFHKNVYKKIGKLDERFQFFYADDDYAMSLRKFNFQHALVTKAHAEHLEFGRDRSKVNEQTEKSLDLHEIPKELPKYVIKEKRYWILNSPRMMQGLIIYHNKWGGKREIRLKLIIAAFFTKLRLGVLNKFIIFHY